MPITRRHLLAAAAATAAAGGLGVGALALRWWDQPVQAPWRHLSAGEVAFLQAAAEALFPPGGRPALAGADAEIPRFFDAILAAMEPTQARLMRLLLNALDASTVPTRGATFAALSGAERREVLQDWIRAEPCEYRAAAQSVMVLAGTAYTTHPATADFFGPLYGCRYGA